MKKYMISNFNSLIGKNKQEIIAELGDQFNIPYEKTWTYELRKNFFIVIELVLIFNEEEILESYTPKNIIKLNITP